MRKEDESKQSFFLDVFDDVSHLEKGVLHEIIKNLAPNRYEEIIHYFSINPYASRAEDIEVLTKNMHSLRPIISKMDPMNISRLSLGIVKKDMNSSRSAHSYFVVGLIFLIAFIAIGLWIIRKYGDSSDRREDDLDVGVLPPQANKLPATLCLVVPCNRIAPSLRPQLAIEGRLSSNDATILIDNAVYFLATAAEEKYTPPLNRDWQALPEGSDLFVRLFIPEGGQIIETDLKRNLSRSVSGQSDISIEEIGLLNDLDDLEKFYQA